MIHHIRVVQNNVMSGQPIDTWWVIGLSMYYNPNRAAMVVASECINKDRQIQVFEQHELEILRIIPIEKFWLYAEE